MQDIAGQKLLEAIELLSLDLNMHTAAVRTLSQDVRANTLMLEGVRSVLLEEGEAEQGAPAPVATYADGSPIG